MQLYGSTVGLETRAQTCDHTATSPTGRWRTEVSGAWQEGRQRLGPEGERRHAEQYPARLHAGVTLLRVANEILQSARESETA